MSPRDASALHHDAVVADTHNDLLMLVVRRPRDEWVSYFRNRWLPQLRAGGVDIQVLPVFIDDEFRPEGSLRETLRMIEAAHRIAEGCPDDVALCVDGAEVDAAVASGRIALVLALEGAPQIDDDIELVQTMHRLGVRIISLAHFGRSMLADGSGEDAAGSRLTRSGVRAVELMEQLGVMLDISHLGAGGLNHVLEIARRPVLATHSSSRALRDHHRNLTDEQLKGVAGSGGVICVNFFPGFLHDTEPTLGRIVDHIQHIAGVVGVDAVGLGPDFIWEVFDEKIPLCDRPVVMEGVDVMVTIPGLEGPTGLPLVTAELVERDVPESDIRRILGANVQDLFRRELGVPLDARSSAS
jgi:membrane dipeptidase